MKPMRVMQGLGLTIVLGLTGMAASAPDAAGLGRSVSAGQSEAVTAKASEDRRKCRRKAKCRRRQRSWPLEAYNQGSFGKYVPTTLVSPLTMVVGATWCFDVIERPGAPFKSPLIWRGWVADHGSCSSAEALITATYGRGRSARYRCRSRGTQKVRDTSLCRGGTRLVDYSVGHPVDLEVSRSPAPPVAPSTVTFDFTGTLILTPTLARGRPHVYLVAGKVDACGRSAGTTQRAALGPRLQRSRVLVARDLADVEPALKHLAGAQLASDWPGSYVPTMKVYTRLSLPEPHPGTYRACMFLQRSPSDLVALAAAETSFSIP